MRGHPPRSSTLSSWEIGRKITGLLLMTSVASGDLKRSRSCQQIRIAQIGGDAPNRQGECAREAGAKLIGGQAGAAVTASCDARRLDIPEGVRHGVARARAHQSAKEAARTVPTDLAVGISPVDRVAGGAADQASDKAARTVDDFATRVDASERVARG